MGQIDMTQPFNFNSFIEGAYTDVGVISIPQNALWIQDNCITSYKLGAILKRPGYERIGIAIQANKSITGLHNFRQSATTQKMLCTVNNSADTALQLFYSTGGNWTEVTDAETAWDTFEDSKVEMEDFLGYCFMVGYDATDAVWLPLRTFTTTTLGTTMTTSMPQAKYIKRYRDRLYLANCYSSATAYPYRVYFSSVPSAGSITWTPASDFIDVDYSEDIKGIGENWDRFIIFTEYSAYMYDQDTKKKVWDVGCSNHRTIRNSGAYMFWANMDGVWISTGGRPENIAGRIIDFIRAADMTTAFAEVIDEEYHLYLGSVSVNGVSYSNCALIFNIPTKTWRWHEYFDTMTVFGTFYSGGEDYLYMGASDGDVHRLGKYTDATLLTADAVVSGTGQPIHSWFMTGGIDFGSPQMEKEIDKIFAYADRAQGLILKSRVIDRNTMALSEFKQMGRCDKYINEFQCNPKKGNFLQIEGVENGVQQYWSLFGFTALVLPENRPKA